MINPSGKSEKSCVTFVPSPPLPSSHYFMTSLFKSSLQVGYRGALVAIK